MHTPTIIELSQEIQKLKEQLMSFNIPSQEYKTHMDVVINDVKNSILDLHDLIDASHQQVSHMKESCIDAINDIGNSLKVAAHPAIIPEFYLIPSITSVKVRISPSENMEDVLKHNIYYSQTKAGVYTCLETYDLGVTIPGLLPNTDYSVYITSVKKDDVENLPSEIHNITTLKID